MLANIVEVKTANISLAELEAAQNAALRAVDELNIPVESGINVFENRVELYVTERVQFDSALWTAKIQLPNHVEVITVDELIDKSSWFAYFPVSFQNSVL